MEATERAPFPETQASSSLSLLGPGCSCLPLHWGSPTWGSAWFLQSPALMPHIPSQGPLNSGQSLIEKCTLRRFPPGVPGLWSHRMCLNVRGRTLALAIRVGSSFSCQAPIVLVKTMRPEEQEDIPKDRPTGHSKNRSHRQLRSSPRPHCGVDVRQTGLALSMSPWPSFSWGGGRSWPREDRQTGYGEVCLAGEVEMGPGRRQRRADPTGYWSPIPWGGSLTSCPRPSLLHSPGQ